MQPIVFDDRISASSDQICFTSLSSHRLHPSLSYGIVYCINPRPNGTPDFPPPPGPGVGVFENYLSRLLLVVEKKKTKKTFESSSKMITKQFKQFFANVKIVAPGPTNGQFAIVKDRFGKPPLSRKLL